MTIFYARYANELHKVRLCEQTLLHPPPFNPHSHNINKYTGTHHNGTYAIQTQMLGIGFFYSK